MLLISFVAFIDCVLFVCGFSLAVLGFVNSVAVCFLCALHVSFVVSRSAGCGYGVIIG